MAAVAARRPHRGGIGGRHGCGDVRAFHTVSSSADPDQADGHEPRPSVTIRQRARRAAVVGPVVGPTMTPTTGVRIGLLLGCASRLRSGRPSSAHALRDGARFVRSRLGASSCATGSATSACPTAQCRLRIAQPPSPTSAAAVCATTQGHVRAIRSPTDVPAGDSRRTPEASWSGLPNRGRACGRADHDPDHAPCVPIVTVVGLSWSVVRSGPAGFLKVSNIRSDLGV